MKRELFYAILFVISSMVFIYVRIERRERTQDYIQKYGIKAYIYRTVTRAAIFIVILIAIGGIFLYMK